MVPKGLSLGFNPQALRQDGNGREKAQKAQKKVGSPAGHGTVIAAKEHKKERGKSLLKPTETRTRVLSQ
jgi:hypothetical protein